MPHPQAMEMTAVRTTLALSCLLLIVSVGLADGGHDDAGHGDHGHGDHGHAGHDHDDHGHDDHAHDDHGHDEHAHGDHGHDEHAHGDHGHDDHAHDDHAHDHDTEGNLSDYVADVSFTLRTGIVDGRLVFVGVGGDIDGVVNPDLVVAHGAVVEIVLENGDGIEHDIVFEDFAAASDHTFVVGERATFAFRADRVVPGSYTYACTMPGHRLSGQEGTIVVVGH